MASGSQLKVKTIKYIILIVLAGCFIINIPYHLNMWYYCRLRSYKKRMFFLLFYVFFDVESESEVSFCRLPLFFKLRK